MVFWYQLDGVLLDMTTKALLDYRINLTNLHNVEICIKVWSIEFHKKNPLLVKLLNVLITAASLVCISNPVWFEER
jgi:hypothetical protein